MRCARHLTLVAPMLLSSCNPREAAPPVNPTPVIAPVPPPPTARAPIASATSPREAPVASLSSSPARGPDIPPSVAADVPASVPMPSPNDIRAARALHCAKRTTGFGCTDSHGKEVIPFEYEDRVLFKRSGLALVFASAKGYFFINGRNETIFRSFLFDNGPDPIAEGLARVQWNGKIGFVDREWRVVIEPRFDAAFGFEGGLAKVCTGCDPRVWSIEAPREARQRVGRVFFVDKTGNEVQR